METKLVVEEVQLERNHVQVGSEDDLMSIAMPEDNTVHTFWVKRRAKHGEMILTTIRGDWTDARPKPRPVPNIE
jgi:hypothetical protein